MCDQCRISYELQKLWKNCLDIRCSYNHLICNTGKLCDLKWNRYFRINECAELISNLSMFYLHRTNLNNLILNWTEPCRLKVKYYISIIQWLSLFIHCHISQVVHQVAFHTVNHFKRIILIQRLNIMVRICKRLNDTVICNRHRRMPPVMRLFQQCCYISYRIHIAHLCMAVKLHTLFRCRIHSGFCKITDLFDSDYRLDIQFRIKTVNRCHTF